MDQLLPLLTNVGWVDWLLLTVAVLSIVLGVWRGFVLEVLSLIGWIVAYVVAQLLAPRLIGQLTLPELGGGADAKQALTFVLVFFVILVVWSLLAKLASMVVKATPLSLIDRVLGTVFGVVRASVVLLVVATVVTMTPAAQSPAWKQSLGAAWLAAALDAIKPLLPGYLSQNLPA